ncbi:unnamed protein product [Trifolium pratense]|uniref:Uncharacterized protein n=1 Tax=Trifolium pratense TaxID=57577 RepID=A0ACB0L2R3_TRIPR|nr:unnamed protein product [Trifolium pratense]
MIMLELQVGRAAFDHWSEWFAVHKMRNTDDHYVPLLSTDRWEKSRLEWLKCNVDATFFVDSGRTTMSACFRNSSSEFTAGITKWQRMVLSTEEGETWTLLQAMNEAKHRGFERVQIRK